MGPPPWSFAADAHDCIMVQALIEPTGYKYAAGFFIPLQKAAPLVNRHPDHPKRAAVLGAVKVWPGDDGSTRQCWRDGQP
jgi:hypothetical protein